MRRMTVPVIILVAVAVCLVQARPAPADNLSIGVQTDSLSLGINIGGPPRVVVVPGTAVYQAPSVPYNYFVYRHRYYLFHEGMWMSAGSYNGPWTVIALERVPPPILTVPVNYYKVPPGHWKERHGPPPWAHANGHDKREHGKKEHGKNRGHDHD
ncbi:MAG TPA: hypothetical protein VEU07_15635 [Candidatus Acidoferrum sp.]|nr:hypothetical protein [Candidatus Acidoferrum sp.]